MSDRIDVEKQRLCSYLLPDPGGEAMRGLLDAYASLQAENERLREVLVSCHQIFSHPGFTDRAGIGERVASIIASKEQES